MVSRCLTLCCCLCPCEVPERDDRAPLLLDGDDTHNDTSTNQPSGAVTSSVYGVKLMSLGRDVPGVVRECVREIEARGLEVQGIYRLSGRRNNVMKMKEELDKGNLSAVGGCEDIHVVTGALKLFFREMPQPLILPSSYSACITAARSGDVERLRAAVSTLPPVHYNTLKFLIKHLFKVQRSSMANLMSVDNLATVFSPNLMQPVAVDSHLVVQELAQQQNMLKMLIANCSDIFTN